MSVKFRFAEEKCMACGACAIACMDQCDVNIETGERPLRRVTQTETDGVRRFFSVSCLHCADAPCAAACPKGCLWHDAELGLTLYDNENCIGCRACARACPVDAPTFVTADGKIKMKKCDGCAERVRVGLTPACVRACPVGALTCAAEE